MTASVYPFSPKLINKRLKVVTMVTMPKSDGARSRARTMVATTWITNTTPWEKNCDSGATHRPPTQFSPHFCRQEFSSLVKRFQCVSVTQRFRVVRCLGRYALFYGLLPLWMEGVITICRSLEPSREICRKAQFAEKQASNGETTSMHLETTTLE